MKVDILASGSSGNCIALTSGESTILVDAGIAKTKIEKALLNVGIRPDNIEAIFITHAHKDHTKGLPLANKYKIPVFASDGEWKDINLVDEELRNEMIAIRKIGGFDIAAFNVHHDAYDPLGYIVKHDNFKVSICLDTGHIDDGMLIAMKKSDIYIIEANHDPRMVEASDYPESVKERILSDYGHLSNKQAAAALTKLVRGKGEQIYLTHLSSNNNIPALAEMTVIKELTKKGLERNKDYYLEVI